MHSLKKVFEQTEILLVLNKKMSFVEKIVIWHFQIKAHKVVYKYIYIYIYVYI